MARFLFQGSYSTEGVKGVLKEGGTGRRAAVEAAIKSVGGKLEAFYYAFGDTDVFVIADGLTNEDALTFSMGIGATGGLHSLKTTVLLSPEEVDKAARKALSYRAPGR